MKDLNFFTELAGWYRSRDLGGRLFQGVNNRFKASNSIAIAYHNLCSIGDGRAGSLLDSMVTSIHT